MKFKLDSLISLRRFLTIFQSIIMEKINGVNPISSASEFIV